MLVITSSDAKAYRLGIAQLIPVLFIALFVVNKSWIVKTKEDARKKVSSAAKIDRERSSGIQEIKDKVERELEDIEKELATLGSIDPSRVSAEMPTARENIDERRAELIRSRAEKMASLNSISKADKRIEQLFYDLLGGSIKSWDRAAKVADRLLKIYTERIITGIIIGFIGEITALWGAIRLISRLFAIAFGSDVAILVAGGLCFFAIDGLTSDSPESRLYKLFQNYSMLAIITVAQLTLAWTLVSVTVVH